MSELLKIDQWIRPTALPAMPGEDELHIWKIDLAGPGPDLSHLLSDDEQRRRTQLVHEDEQVRFGNARGALRTVLSGYSGLSPARISLGYSDKGKPLLHSAQSDIQFNLTHAGGLALLAVGRGLPVGIDLERLSRRNNLRRIARKVFPPALLNQLESLNEAQFEEAFYRHWTALEARVKAVGAGIFSQTPEITALPCINFQPHEGWCAAIAADGRLPPAENWVALQFSPDLVARIG